jgi:hypothetical protein
VSEKDDNRSSASTEALYASPAEALKKVCSEYEYWSGRLTEGTLQMSYAVIAADWAVFGSINGILDNFWAKMSLLMVIFGLAANLIGAWFLSEALRKRVEYGEADSPRWNREFTQYRESACAWPFTDPIQKVGGKMRLIKATFALAGAGFLIVGAILK